jgi:hypothetical protein
LSARVPKRSSSGPLAAVLAALCAALVGCGGGGPESSPAAAAGEDLYGWSWQRSEDLSFIDPADTKLALWVATITVHEDAFVADARANLVRYPQGTDVLPVVRIETTLVPPATTLKLIAQQIAALVTPLDAREVQLDFDATVSQREAYRRLIEDLRAELPAHRVSITALASWCLGDPWIDALPIDAAVPMYYRMGPDAPEVRHFLSESRPRIARICADNAGYSLDEPDVPIVAARRVFLFNAAAWDEATLEAARSRYGVESSR